MGDHVEIGSSMFGPGRVPGPGIEALLKEQREKLQREEDELQEKKRRDKTNDALFWC